MGKTSALRAATLTAAEEPALHAHRDHRRPQRGTRENRQLRRMCAQSGLTLLRLPRIREDCLTLGSLKAGTWRDLTPEEVSALKGETPKPAKGLRPGR